MEMNNKKNIQEKEYQRNEVYSRTLRAGNRTYFFDVKKTRSGEHYLTITESKKQFSEEGHPIYKKYKLHLYREDFHKFQESINETINFIVDKNEKIKPKNFQSDNYNNKEGNTR